VTRLVLLALLLAAPPVAAQSDSLARAFEMERRGNFAGAIPLFKSVLRTTPGNVNAVIGLERALLPLGRTSELVPELRAALAASPAEPALYGVAIRTWNTLGQPDSVRRAAEKWASVQPNEETPYREWGNALLMRKDRAGARQAFMTGRQKLGKPDALAPELAELASLEGDFPASAQEWLLAMKKLPGYRASALAYLRTAPDHQRKDVLAALAKDPSPDARRLDAELRARWGDPLGAYERLVASLPAEKAQQVEVLRLFGESLRGQTSPPARVAYGRTLEAVSERTSGSQAQRLRLDAAQAYLDGGDRVSARRMLTGLADEGGTPANLAAPATATLVRLLVEEGKFEEAEQRLAGAKGKLPADDAADLTRRVALGWARSGKLDRADRMVAGDSSVSGLALRGELKLLHGEVAQAKDLLQQAGPYAGSREDATERTSLLALLQPMEADTVPEIGTGFLALARADTTAAVAAFSSLAGRLPPDKGGAEARLLAGRLEARRGHVKEAESLLRSTASTKETAAAPAALLELGRLLARGGRSQEAVAVLEQLILDHPRSALVPQARRAIDEARGAVPPS
jgi:tetratricopeptide (TPR) repeat protein